MKRTSTCSLGRQVAFFLLIASLSGTTLLGEEDLFMALSYDDAVELAANEDRRILVKFHADWCHWCRLMDSETFKDAGVIESLDPFIPIRIDVGSQKGMRLAQELGVFSVPTIIILDGRGEVVATYVGFKSSEQMQNLLTDLESAGHE